MIDKRGTWILAYAAVMLVTIVRVAATHRVFTEVLDEPVHVASGMQWLTRGTMSLDPSHPPLERILSALPLRIAGIGFQMEADSIQTGNRILYARGEHERNLVLARIGNLLLLLLMIGSTAAWARRYFEEPIPWVSAALLACMPPVLGHAGIATTDIAVATTIPLCLYALDRFLDGATRGRAAVLGFAVGIGLLSKFSFLLFFPLAAAVVMLLRRRMPPLGPIAIAVVVAFLAVWAGYRFSFGRVGSINDSAGFVAELAPAPLKPLAMWFGDHVPIPAPEFVIGAGIVKLHDRGGHPSYLLGKYSDRGWWYYFPVVLFYKTPIPFLILAAWGIGALVLKARREHSWGPLQFALVPLVILLAAMTSRINIGIRHILPVYPGLAVVAGLAVVTIARQSREAFSRAALAALLLWLVIGTSVAHPDYLAWFNEAAGDHPETIVVDSNLDWGQDVFRLRRAVRELHIKSLTTMLASNAWLFRTGIPTAPPLPPNRKRGGWIAVSETQNVILGRSGALAWLAGYRPVRRVGKSIRLYYVPSSSETTDVGPAGASNVETILLPFAGTTVPSGAPSGARWLVDQTIRNGSGRSVHVSLSHCAGIPSCDFDLRPHQTVRIAGSDPGRPFIEVTVARSDASALSFSTVARRVDKSVPGSDIVVPAVPRSAFRSDSIEIANVPFSRMNRLNLRLYTEPGAASSANVRVFDGDRVIAEGTIPIYDTGYYVIGDFGRFFPQLASREVRATVTIEAPARLWAFITETDAAGGGTVYLPK